MISRRQLMQFCASACTAPLIGNSYAKESTPPKRAVFIFIPMGSINAGWLPERCSTSLASGGELLAPFAPVAERCLVPRNTFIPNGGFGTPFSLLAKRPFDSSLDSLDILLSKHFNKLNPTEGGHLHLCAKELSSVNNSVSRAGGKEVPFETNPINLLNRLQAFGLPENFDADALLTLDSSVDSQSIFDVKRYLALTKAALQTGYSNSVTLMIGDDEAQLQAPPSLDLSVHNTLRIYTPTGRWQDFLKFKAYLHQLVAQFIFDLATTLDADGEPLLDSTLVYLFSNMGDGNAYTGDNAPTLLAGADSLFRTGEVLNHGASSYSILNAIAYAFLGKSGLIFGDDVAFNLLRHP